MKPSFTVLVLTEDAAGQDVVRTVVTKALQFVDPQANLRPEERWLRPDAKVELAMRGSYWKSTSEAHEPDRRALLRAIATHLLRSSFGFVVFHFDGDERWSRRKHSENVDKWAGFRVLVEQHVRQVKSDADIARSALARLLAVTPFYCMESWLYLATSTLLDLCSEDHKGRHHAEINHRSRVPRAIEELVRPWEVWCAGKAANPRLAARFDAETAHDLQQSFYETVERMVACSELIEALRSTRWASDSPG